PPLMPVPTPRCRSFTALVAAAMLPISLFSLLMPRPPPRSTLFPYTTLFRSGDLVRHGTAEAAIESDLAAVYGRLGQPLPTQPAPDRKSTRLNSSHVAISYAVFCLKKKNTLTPTHTPMTKRSSSSRRHCVPSP